MRCRINYDTDPISLTVIAAYGFEHDQLDAAGHNGIIEVSIVEKDEDDVIENE